MLHLPPRWRTAVQARNAVAKQLQTRHSLRMHSIALFAWILAIGYLMSKLTLATGIQALSARYFFTGISTYLAFFLGVRIWLWFVNAATDNRGSELDAGDMVDGVDVSLDVADIATGGSSDILGGIGDGIGAAAGDGCLPILVIGFLAIGATLLFGLFGPEMLIEIAFEAVLAGSLVSTMRLGREPNWFSTVFRKTIWTFLIIMFVMMMFGKYAQKHYPEAQTTKQVIHQMMQKNDLTKNQKKN